MLLLNLKKKFIDRKALPLSLPPPSALQLNHRFFKAIIIAIKKNLLEKDPYVGEDLCKLCSIYRVSHNSKRNISDGEMAQQGKELVNKAQGLILEATHTEKK